MAVSIAAAAAGVPAAAAALYLLLLALASFRRPRETPLDEPGARLLVLVPAHDEEGLVGRCLASLQAQTYPRSSYRVVVIADNCSDRTAELARAGGAGVLERRDAERRGKG